MIKRQRVKSERQTDRVTIDKLYNKRNGNIEMSFKTHPSLKFEVYFKFNFETIKDFWFFFRMRMKRVEIIYTSIAFFASISILGNILLKVYGFEKASMVLQPIIIVFTVAW